MGPGFTNVLGIPVMVMVMSATGNIEGGVGGPSRSADLGTFDIPSLLMVMNISP